MNRDYQILGVRKIENGYLVALTEDYNHLEYAFNDWKGVSDFVTKNELKKIDRNYAQDNAVESIPFDV